MTRKCSSRADITSIIGDVVSSQNIKEFESLQSIHKYVLHKYNDLAAVWQLAHMMPFDESNTYNSALFQCDSIPTIMRTCTGETNYMLP